MLVENLAIIDAFYIYNIYDVYVKKKPDIYLFLA